MSESTTLTAPKPSAPAKAKEKTNILCALDRCDRSVTCDAAAYVRVFFEYGGHIQFCGHHYQENEVALFPFVVHEKTIDERHKLVSNRLKGSENS